MGRFSFAAAALVAVAGSASAHFPYLIPAGPTGGYEVAFNDGPRVDERVAADLYQDAKFRLVNGSGIVSEVVGKPGENGRTRITGDAATVYGTLPYGVLFRGDVNPVFVVYHPKAVATPVRVGDSPKPIGEPLELTPAATAGGVGFLVTEKGKPVAGADVAVYPPGETKPTVVKTDATGRTQGFDKPGEYGARVYRPMAVSGEYQGRRYAGERHYATLTAKYEPGK